MLEKLIDIPYLTIYTMMKCDGFRPYYYYVHGRFICDEREDTQLWFRWFHSVCQGQTDISSESLIHPFDDDMHHGERVTVYRVGMFHINARFKDVNDAILVLLEIHAYQNSPFKELK